jgi:hypothetical protein
MGSDDEKFLETIRRKESFDHFVVLLEIRHVYTINIVAFIYTRSVLKQFWRDGEHCN